MTLDFGTLSGGLRHATADEVHLNYGGELTISAGHLEGDLAQSQYDANGQVSAHAHDTTLTADSLHANGLSHLGFSERATLTRRPFTIKAQTIEFQPTGLTASDANITTAKPGDNPDIELRVGLMTVKPDQKPGQPDTGRERVGLHERFAVRAAQSHLHPAPLRDDHRRRGRRPGPAAAAAPVARLLAPLRRLRLLRQQREAWPVPPALQPAPAAALLPANPSLQFADAVRRPGNTPRKSAADPPARAPA